MQQLLTIFFSTVAVSSTLGCDAHSELQLYAVFDSLTALAYCSIALFLVYFTRQGSHSKAFLVFAVGFLICGAAQLTAVWTVWYSIYWLSVTLKAASALIFVLFAALVPQAIANASLNQTKNLQKQPLQQVEENQDLPPIQIEELAKKELVRVY